MSEKSNKMPAVGIPKYMKFTIGGLAGMGATVFVQPLDLVKNRMQLSGEGGQSRQYKSSGHALITVLRNEGITGIYTGLSAGLLRQATYTTTRMGIYSSLFEKFSVNGKPPSFIKKVLIGVFAGGVGAFVGTPAELALIRMTADGRLPVEQRRGYKNVFDALRRVWLEEGFRSLFRGSGPTIGRAMVVNASQLSSYSQVKQFFLDKKFKDGLLLHFVSSMISGFITTLFSMPVDIVKTRIQNMKTTEGKQEYKGATDVFLRTVKKEGFFSLWKGFLPYYFRLGPHTVLTFIFIEQMNKMYATVVLKDPSAARGL
ncbi:mitochondrial 2-oxoglutarate/malate carrier protein-like [Ostrea edulis]|uniref:mitochondrial 2-oxoglutarate/malate carrier protein-like n=1 Tax=Ostrea edulis TaxID=37623 RepID=UPI0020964955|nr:mitochondrial 2-oxoglutarate/malate carrier protein-like [Ostrea edulis]